MRYQVRHSIPGRVRLHIPDLDIIDELAPALNDWLSEREGFRSARINPLCASVTITYDRLSHCFLRDLECALANASPQNLIAERQGKPHFANGASANRAGLGWLEPRGWPALALSSTAMMLTIGRGASPIVAALSLYAALPIARRAGTALLNESRFNVDLLDTLAFTVAAWQDRWFTAAFMTWLITLGDWIRDRTAAQSRKAVTRMLDFQERTAWVVRDGEKAAVPVREIAPHETVLVYPGDMIPVDGEVIGGRATVDQRSITGESMPALKRRGDRVYASSSVHEGKLSIRTSRVAGDSLAAQIVRMVEMAPVGETRAQNYAEKFADRLVIPTLGLGAGLYLATRDVNLTLSAFIVDFGTGIRVAAPTSVLAAMVAAMRRGVLIRGGSHMERLSAVDAMVFDKTGTLTEGEPRVVEIVSYDQRHFPPSTVLALAAAAEMRFNHPVAVATLAKAKEAGVPIPEREHSRYSIGMGVEATVDGYFLHLGNERFLRRSDVDLSGARLTSQRANDLGMSSLMLAVNGDLVGQLIYQDRIRAESGPVIRALKQRKIRELVLLTGDNPDAARAVARQLGLGKVIAEVLPEQKAELIEHLKDEGKVVAMVGDGINDAPALGRASVGIAMSSGADIAQGTAHVILMHNDLRRLVTAIDVSRDAMKLIRQNYAVVAGMNIAALALALCGGITPPEITALISNGSAVLASVNGLRPLLAS